MTKLTNNLPKRHIPVTIMDYTIAMRFKSLNFLWAAGLAFAVSLHPVTSAWASGAGTTGADVLKIGVGARAMAMGEAYAAQADDVSSLYWNPGGLALMQERQASF